MEELFAAILQCLTLALHIVKESILSLLAKIEGLE